MVQIVVVVDTVVWFSYCDRLSCLDLTSPILYKLVHNLSSTQNLLLSFCSAFAQLLLSFCSTFAQLLLSPARFLIFEVWYSFQTLFGWFGFRFWLIADWLNINETTVDDAEQLSKQNQEPGGFKGSIRCISISKHTMA